MDGKAKNVVTTSKIFSKIRNRIKTKQLKIQLKTNKPRTEDDEGISLNPVANTGDNAPLDPLSDDNYYDGYNDTVGDEYELKDQPLFKNDEEEGQVVRYSPSPEPERPHHRRRRKRRHERGEEIVAEVPRPQGGQRHVWGATRLRPLNARCPASEASHH